MLRQDMDPFNKKFAIRHLRSRAARNGLSGIFFGFWSVDSARRRHRMFRGRAVDIEMFVIKTYRDVFQLALPEAQVETRRHLNVSTGVRVDNTILVAGPRLFQVEKEWEITLTMLAGFHSPF